MANKKNFDQLIAAAVIFWASMFKDIPYGDKANGGQMLGFESVLMTFTKMSVNNAADISDSKIEKFKELLTKHLQGQAEIMRNCTLDTDWAPEWPLSDFLRKSDLPNTCFPSKTMMLINFTNGTVTVKENQIFPAVK